jgi:hypothetical protein
MNEYIVDHNGGCRANDKEGTLYVYKAGKPVYLPEDVAKALGDSAKATGRKEEKNFLDKAKDTMIHGSERDLKTK